MTVTREEIAGVVLAAGEGTRLRPLTFERPKAMCPVGTVPLVDWAIDRVAPHVGSVVRFGHRLFARTKDHLGLNDEVAALFGRRRVFHDLRQGVELANQHGGHPATGLANLVECAVDESFIACLR